MNHYVSAQRIKILTQARSIYKATVKLHYIIPRYHVSKIMRIIYKRSKALPPLSPQLAQNALK